MEKSTKPDPEIDSTVTNLSSHELTEAQTSLLSKGLKFISSRRTVDLGDLST